MKVARFIGVDGSSEKLDLFDSGTGKALELTNSRNAIMRLARKIENPQETLVMPSLGWTLVPAASTKVHVVRFGGGI